jgi:hypothetical protein
VIVCLILATFSACGEIATKNSSSSVVARSNEVNIGDDSANLQYAAFDILSGMTDQAAEVLLEQQDFVCHDGECILALEYQDSFLAANYGIGQRNQRADSPFNKGLVRTTTYSIRFLALRINRIEDLAAHVTREDNYNVN